jgi:hypothetical protein
MSLGYTPIAGAVSAEIRWFWKEEIPVGIRDWFFQGEPRPGGGPPFRTDRYISQVNSNQIGIKERGGKHGFEIKGLVATSKREELKRIASYFEIWCKWSCIAPYLDRAEKVTTHKTRWLRKFDTAGSEIIQIPLDENGNPKPGYIRPSQGCNVELTKVEIPDQSQVWWTLGFEAFGDITTAQLSLLRVAIPEDSTLSDLVPTGHFMSYPAWIAEWIVER